jgi:CRP-like cAMP-binding protein
MGEAVSPERVRGMEIFQGLSDEEYEMVAKVCRQETYEEGSVIFNEGEESRKVYIVDSGRVVCESEAAPGKRVIVGSEVKGGICG